jgi:hypothetical protein
MAAESEFVPPLFPVPFPKELRIDGLCEGSNTDPASAPGASCVSLRSKDPTSQHGPYPKPCPRTPHSRAHVCATGMKSLHMVHDSLISRICPSKKKKLISRKIVKFLRK